ncbi:hypothetical protein F3Y22_tig00111810pilonHSYRG00045 [Hibiscus syriacus]|uniref:16S rRNA (uracil(1498)-N(3))-methyltransferase n=1 Tax=Hibiscus syriacus TaxID=106335 RepID=A0A6A2XZX5_HIBSY|nr:hypothetical protein F3Y22_tig00111810pilonHSYRG00045 [Hibiscus syriacus]
MSKWRIFSEDGSNYRWENIGPVSPSKLDDDPKETPIAPYHSMADLLLEGSSKLIDDDDKGVDKYLMFKTEFGNSVALKESLIGKAVSILNEDEVYSTVTPTNAGAWINRPLVEQSQQWCDEMGYLACKRSVDLMAATSSLKGGRADWLVEKCTELGVSSVTLLLTKRSSTISDNRVERLQRVILAALDFTYVYDIFC